MTQVTTPDNIAKWTNEDPSSFVQASQTEGDSVQAAFNKRQRYTYMWPTSAERIAQTGMVEGSLGYQIDTRVDYIYRSSNWIINNALMQTFTPSWVNITVGTGAVSNGFVTVAGGWANVICSLTLGTGFSISVDVYVEPPTIAPVSSTLLGLGAVKMGFSNFEDISAGADGRYEGTAIAFSSISATPYPNGVFRLGYLSNAALRFTAISSTAPFTWVAGDKIHVTVSYPVQA